jgi:hypothetical protein
LAEDSEFQPMFAVGQFFALAGPSVKLDPAVVPVRGDLAHIRLAGKVFVPHYIVPVAYRAKADVAVLKSAGGEAIGTLTAGAAMDVLDIAGGYAWGEISGAVGYVALDQLELVA